MNLNRWKLGVGASVVVALLSACGTTTQSAAGPHQFTASGYGPFTPAAVTLKDTSGAPYALTTPKTPLTLVFFGYTHCPDECPAMMSQIGSAFSRLSAAQIAQVTMVFVTTDPARDSGSVERRWLDRYDSRFVGLTGPIDEIIKLSSSLKLYVKGATRLPSGGYDVPTHATNLVALNAQHVAVAEWSLGTTSKQFASDIQALLNGSVPQ